MKKRVLVVLSPGFAANDADSTCLPAQQSLLRCLNRLYPFLTIRIIAFQYPHHSVPYLWNGNTVLPLNGKNRGGWRRWITWLKASRVLLGLHRRENITGILSFWLGECALTGYHAARLLRVPHITWVLGQDAKAGNRYAKRLPLEKMMLAAVSDSIAERMRCVYGLKTIPVLHNAIDDVLFPANSFADRPVHIIGVGSLIPLKQYDVFIDIIARTAASIKGLRVVLCGKGPEQARLQQLVSEKKLEHIFRFEGEKKHAEVIALLQQSRVLLHTSSYEGLSGACLEALAAGAHVISFTGENNIPVPQWHIKTDKEGMVQQLLCLLEDPSTRYEPVIPFRMEETAKQLMHLFTQQTDGNLI